MVATIELPFSLRGDISPIWAILRNCRDSHSDLCIKFGNSGAIRTGLDYYFGDGINLTFGLKNKDNFVGILLQHLAKNKTQNITVLSDNTSFTFRASVI